MESRFAREFSPSELKAARAMLESRAWKQLPGCVGFFVVSMLLLAVIQCVQIALLLIPVLLLALATHSYLGRRIWRVRSGSGLLLWLRRFHRRDLRRFPFGALLTITCGGQACPVTIQDSTYQRSWNSLFARGSFTVIVTILFSGFVALLIVGAYIVGLSFLMTLFEVPDEAASVLLALSVLASPLGLFFIGRALIGRGCYMRVGTTNAAAKMARLIRRVKRGYGTSALQIVKCDDAVWHDVVRQSLASADAVLVDVSDVNENVEWELAQIRSRVARGKLILCCASSGGELLCDEALLMQRLEHCLGSEVLASAYRVAYELPVEVPGLRGLIGCWFGDYPPIAVWRCRREFVDLNCAIGLALATDELRLED